ncbi:hypothetical protein SAV31267_086330 [Streptomyces avermitilis]|uniref:AMP-dependent synthetase/ligase domain-containing protein n=1 Tax=Streptomyces avermitilis TaxID=33903 RepID=A0A4D4N3Q5_STRAX|nr:hypothetical protein SAV31267_086330 [Streptomyces avermitilis]
MHPLIHQAVIVGENRPCVGALITLDPDYLPHWRTMVAAQADAPSREAREQNAVLQEVTRAVAAANSFVSRSESIRVFRILPEPFDPANGLLTPSMKLRRDVIVRRYATEIDAMYQSSARTRVKSLSDEPVSWEEHEENEDDVFRRVR